MAHFVNASFWSDDSAWRMVFDRAPLAACLIEAGSGSIARANTELAGLTDRTPSELRAWAQLTDSYLRGEPTGLETYFNGPALAGILDAIAVSGAPTSMIFDLKHRVHVDFYSVDGQVVSFTDEMTILRGYQEDGVFQDTIESDETFRVVMLLQDGNWRIRQMIRESAEVNTAPIRDSLETDGVVGVNYYPQATPWLEFWTETEPETIEADLATASELGFNTVRIFVPFPVDRIGMTNDEMGEELNEFLGTGSRTGPVGPKISLDNRHGAAYRAQGGMRSVEAGHRSR